MDHATRKQSNRRELNSQLGFPGVKDFRDNKLREHDL